MDPYLADTGQPFFKTYRRVVASLAHAVELKRLCAGGAEPMPGKMRGLTIPRPVHITSIEHMGKEVIVDPTDTPEELTAELLSSTEVLVYQDPRKALDGLRARVRALGVSNVARTSRISRSQMKAFVNQGATPQASTVARIEAALERLTRQEAHRD
jgi:DNA-binding phage protein